MAQHLSEAALLTIVASVIALGVLCLAAPALHNAAGIDLRPALADNLGFWVSLAGLLTVVTLVGGGYPALVLSRVPPIEALRIGRSRVGSRFTGTLLVAVQFAAASFLLIVVMVMHAQNGELKRTGLGNARDPLACRKSREPLARVMSRGAPPSIWRCWGAHSTKAKGLSTLTSTPSTTTTSPFSTWTFSPDERSTGSMAKT
jgi:hypothetical protein